MNKHLGKFFVLLALLGALMPQTFAQEEDLQEITLFVSYIPSVQFAPIYAAIEEGYFAEEGLAVTVEHSFNEADGVDRLALNDLQFAIISGEQVIVARNADKPLVYVYEWFHSFPVGIVAPADSGISEVGDLVGKKVGIPGPFGASYMGLRAILATQEIDELELQLESIGFTAPEAVCQGQVEAAVVYITNEPLTITENCFPVTVLPVSDYATLVANGLVTNEETIAENPDLVASMVRALRRGVEFTIADPEAAFELSVQNHVQDLPEEQYKTQRQVLANSIALWESETLGQTDPLRWENTQALMLEIGFLSEELDDLSAAYTNGFLPQD
jgi:NitT/TauT family transport system substrate-binding protein